jgi:hypothetical protein
MSLCLRGSSSARSSGWARNISTRASASTACFSDSSTARNRSKSILSKRWLPRTSPDGVVRSCSSGWFTSRSLPASSVKRTRSACYPHTAVFVEGYCFRRGLLLLCSRGFRRRRVVWRQLTSTSVFPLTVEQTPTVPLEILNPLSSYGLGLRRGDLVVHDFHSMAFGLAAIGGGSIGAAVGAHEDADLERNFVRIGHGLSLPPRLLWLGSPRKTSPLATSLWQEGRHQACSINGPSDDARSRQDPRFARAEKPGASLRGRRSRRASS